MPKAKKKFVAEQTELNPLIAASLLTNIKVKHLQFQNP